MRDRTTVRYIKNKYSLHAFSYRSGVRTAVSNHWQIVAINPTLELNPDSRTKKQEHLPLVHSKILQ